MANFLYPVLYHLNEQHQLFAMAPAVYGIFAGSTVAGLNSMALLPQPVAAMAININTVLLAMAMAALVLTTHISAIHNAGIKPQALATLLFAWLTGGGLAINAGIAGPSQPTRGRHAGCAVAADLIHRTRGVPKMHTVQRFRSALFFALTSALVAFGALSAHAQEVLHVYGPGGPAPAMKEVAQVFGAANKITVEVTAGPTPQWVDKAKVDADVVFSGAENMMSDFAKALPGALDLKNAEPLYLRPVAILVRPGNPKRIDGFRDLLKPGIKVMAVAGAGQTGLWEDVAGRTGDIGMVRAFRKNLILPEASNSAEARKRWIDQPDIDAWLIWNIWQVANPDLAQLVEMDEPFRIYRDTSVVLTHKGAEQAQAKAFVAFLQSRQGQSIFAKWGWKTP